MLVKLPLGKKYQVMLEIDKKEYKRFVNWIKKRPKSLKYLLYSRLHRLGMKNGKV